ARLRKTPAIVTACIGKPTTHELISIYYDTPELKLLDAGISLRVRHVSGRHISGNWLQTLKAAGRTVAGLHQRMEWEDVIADDHPDFTKILDPDLIKSFADKKLRDALIPIFRTEVRRQEWQLAFDNGDKVELALDLGQLVAGKNLELISELELELKAGSAGRLFDLALEIQKVVPIRLENISKGQRGYAYYRAQPPSIFKAQPIKLAHKADAHSAFKQIAWECIHHLQSNQDMVLHGMDVEGVHQMRVALRRLRSAFVLFRKVLGRENSIALLTELSWLGDVLGKARDLDVFVTQTLPIVMTQFENHIGLQELHNKALTAQAEAYADLRAVLASQRYQALLLTLAAWLENERWHDSSHNTKHTKALSIAKTSLSKHHKQLRQPGKSLLPLSTEERHAIRIAAKKLRYASEFFASFYSSSKSKSFIRKLTQLQDQLGMLNDMTITENLLSQFVGLHPKGVLNETLHIFTGWNACNATRGVVVMDKVWRKFISKKPFWH
ncbi:MAG TPA: CYTH and CHAD domain-containing protein, partial [Methylotenera sp.]|nr:CYTH and CHAD domain-containing protein [Methylotenera sp.]